MSVAYRTDVKTIQGDNPAVSFRRLVYVALNPCPTVRNARVTKVDALRIALLFEVMGLLRVAVIAKQKCTRAHWSFPWPPGISFRK